MRNFALILIVIFGFGCSSNTMNDYSNMNLNGEIESIIENQFNENNQLVFTKKFYFNQSGFVDTTVYINSKTITIYNWKNRIVNQVLTHNEISINQEYRQLDNNVDSITIFDLNETILGVGKIYYNENMSPFKTISLSPQGDTLFIEKTSYNPDRNITEIIFQSMDSTAENTMDKFSYDSSGKRNHYSHYKNGIIIFEENYQYESDKSNNWILKTVFDKNGDFKGIVKREITYK